MANYIYKDGELCHYGVPGMRWGVRKARPTSSNGSGLFRRKSKTKPEAEQVKPQSVKKRKLSELSDEELKNKIARLDLEKRYKELSKTVNPPKSTRGRDFTLRVIEKIGENVLTDIGTQAGATLLGEFINKSAGVKSDDTAKRVVNPRKNQTNKK